MKTQFSDADMHLSQAKIWKEFLSTNFVDKNSFQIFAWVDFCLINLMIILFRKNCMQSVLIEM